MSSLNIFIINYYYNMTIFVYTKVPYIVRCILEYWIEGLYGNQLLSEEEKYGSNICDINYISTDKYIDKTRFYEITLRRCNKFICSRRFQRNLTIHFGAIQHHLGVALYRVWIEHRHFFMDYDPGNTNPTYKCAFK